MFQNETYRISALLLLLVRIHVLADPASLCRRSVILRLFPTNRSFCNRRIFVLPHVVNPPTPPPTVTSTADYYSSSQLMLTVLLESQYYNTPAATCFGITGSASGSAVVRVQYSLLNVFWML